MLHDKRKADVDRETAEMKWQRADIQMDKDPDQKVGCLLNRQIMESLFYALFWLRVHIWNSLLHW